MCKKNNIRNYFPIRDIEKNGSSFLLWNISKCPIFGNPSTIWYLPNICLENLSICEAFPRQEPQDDLFFMVYQPIRS